MPNRDPEKQEIARAYASVATSIVDIWMDRSSSAAGHLLIGTVLTEAFYSPNRWVSPQYILSRIGVYSVDTIRRRLEEMVDYGVVEFTEIDTKKVYRATEAAAEATLKAYKTLTPA